MKESFKDWLAWYPKKHPGAWSLISVLLVHLHTLCILFYLVLIAIDMKNSGYGKYISMYKTVVLLFVEDYIVVLVLAMIAIVFLIAFYLLVWRIFFNDYIRVHEDISGNPAVRTREGRIYWIQDYGFSAWAKKRRGEKIDTVKIWYNSNLIFNVFFPMRSLHCMEGVDQKDIEHDGIRMKLVHERGRRIRLKSDDRIYGVQDNNMIMHDTNVEVAKLNLDESIQRFVKDTNAVIKADAHEAKEKYRYSTTGIPEDIYNDIEKEIKKYREVGY